MAHEPCTSPHWALVLLPCPRGSAASGLRVWSRETHPGIRAPGCPGWEGAGGEDLAPKPLGDHPWGAFPQHAVPLALFQGRMSVAGIGGGRKGKV